MATEYRLSLTAEEIDEKLKNIQSFFIGTKSEYEIGVQDGVVTDKTLCFIVDISNAPTPTPNDGVIQDGNILTIHSDIVITRNGTELVLGA